MAHAKDILIKAGDLRIGNLCMDKLTGEWLLVDEIRKNEKDEHIVWFYVINRDKYPLPDGWQAEYITLTPGILKKFGFEYDDSENVFTFKDFIIDFSIHDGVISYNGERLFDENITETFPLHRIQNLYFALTNEELTINL